MAPKQDLELLIGEDKGGTHGSPGMDADATLSEHDGAHVIVVPSTNSSRSQHESLGKGNPKEKHKSGSGKQGNESGGPETPKNCPHLETALFFFGIAGMIVSLTMLLLHFLRKITPYY